MSSFLPEKSQFLAGILLYRRIYINIKSLFEKIINITGHGEDANLNHNDTLSHPLE